MYILSYGIFFTGNFQEATTTTWAHYHKTRTTTYVESGYRISKTSPVNLALMSFTPRPVATVMVKGQFLRPNTTI